MKFRIGFLLGLGVGYVFGTKAGRERYEQIVAGAKKVAASEPVRAATEQVESAVGEVRAAVGETLHHASERIREAVGSD